MNEIGKWLMVAGLLLAGVGAFLWLGPKIPWLGRLPGDIAVERPNFKFYFPLTTCIIVSVVLTLLAWLLRRH
ncbi:MAG: DUF2905 domain-containing protein [Pedosphaera sp.]|nr:DUF2905 domain-containing protein [Pedosphaera sp.]